MPYLNEHHDNFYEMFKRKRKEPGGPGDGRIEESGPEGQRGSSLLQKFLSWSAGLWKPSLVAKAEPIEGASILNPYSNQSFDPRIVNSNHLNSRLHEPIIQSPIQQQPHNNRSSPQKLLRKNHDAHQPQEGQTAEEIDLLLGTPSAFSTPNKRKAESPEEDQDQMSSKKMKRILKKTTTTITESNFSIRNTVASSSIRESKSDYAKLLDQHRSPDRDDVVFVSRKDFTVQCNQPFERRKLRDFELTTTVKRIEITSLEEKIERIGHSLSSSGPRVSNENTAESDVDKLTSAISSLELPKSVREFKEECEKITTLEDGWISKLLKEDKLKKECRRKEVERRESEAKHLLGKRKVYNDLYEKIRQEKESFRQLTWIVPYKYKEPEHELEPEVETILEDLIELTDEQVKFIEGALANHLNEEDILVEKFNITIRRKDIRTLNGLNWLNDEIINFYFSLICEKRKKVYAFNTFFYPKLITGKQRSLARWTRKVDIFSYDRILIPIHLGMHWTLAVVDMREKKISYYDSMGGTNKECLLSLHEYLIDEHKDKKKIELTDNFELVKEEGIPQQFNGSDCGMFTCKYAEFITRDAKLNFEQSNMQYYRRRMIYEIITKQLLNETYE